MVYLISLVFLLPAAVSGGGVLKCFCWLAFEQRKSWVENECGVGGGFGCKRLGGGDAAAGAVSAARWRWVRRRAHLVSAASIIHFEPGVLYFTLAQFSHSDDMASKSHSTFSI